jgi:predicted transcriptional regulator
MALILIALRPSFAEAIYNRSKLFEFRRVKAKIRPDDRILVYESAPISKVTGEFNVGKVVYGKPSQILNLEPNSNSRTAAAQYLTGAKLCTAIEVVNPIRWEQSMKLGNLYPSLRPPQSYLFIEK